MNLHSLLNSLSTRQIKLSADGDSLIVDAPKGTLTPELRDAIQARKAEILALLQQKVSAFRDDLPALVPDPQSRYEPFPLTDMQHAFWIGRSGVLDLGQVSNHGYYEIEGKHLDLERLNAALQRLIERHDMLRAIVLSDGRQQILKDVPPYSMKVLDLRGQDQKAIATQLEAIRQEMSHQVLPSDKYPLFDFRVSFWDDERFRLHISYDLLVFDAWSLFRLFEEWFELYQHPQRILPPLELSYRDYVLAEQSLCQTQLYQRSQEYWLKRIDTLSPAPDLPLAKNPKELKQHHCRRYNGQLKTTDWQRLKQKATQRGLTPSGLLLAAFAEIISLWSRSPQFTLNLALFNRLPLHPQVNNLLGDFISVTLLAVDNSRKESFSDRALRLQQQLAQDLEHRYFSGVRVTRELTRRQGSVPGALPVIFTSTLGFAALGQETLTFSHFGELVYGISQASQAWIDVQVWEEKNTLSFNWDVVEELFPEGMIEQMLAAQNQLLKQLVEDETSWQQTSFKLIPSEQLEQRATVNATQAPASTQLLHTLFKEQVEQRRQQMAVISSKRTLTYEQTNQLANQIGHRLRKLGSRPNQLVAVVMEKGWEQVVAVLGILYGGAAYLPIEPSLPQERVWQLLEQGEVSLILTQPWINQTLTWPEGTTRLEITEQWLAQVDEPPLEPIQSPEDLAYVIFTSGSTGIPKGVMIDHRGAVNTILDINQRFRVTERDRVLALSALNFDLSVYDIFGLLAAGGTIILPDAAHVKDPSHWLKLITQHQVTLWNSVPALIQMLVEYLAPNGTDASLAPLRLILLSGDWIPLNLPQKIRALTCDLQLISLGGATEASIWSILYPIETVDAQWKSIPYGKPMLNQTFHVLNQNLEPCPIWVPGYLYIGGIGLAQGYWRDTLKTQESFITHPDTGERLYKTGDLGRYLADGNIEFLGREDFQVKINGHRIELGEIETALEQHPSVDRAIVKVITVEQQAQLAAYIVSQDAKLPTIEELSQFLRRKLPDYMIPFVFLFLNALPMSANGKVDRQALPTQNVPFQKLEVPYLAPQNENEQAIASVLQAILGVEKVGINDNFFDLGANSLLITNAYRQLSKALPQSSEFISLVDWFSYPTVKTLAQRLTKAEKGNDLVLPEIEAAEKLNQGKNRLKQKLEKSRLNFLQNSSKRQESRGKSENLAFDPQVSTLEVQVPNSESKV